MSASTAHALAQRVTDAHGGLDAWYEAPAHAVHFSSGGLAFAAKGEGRALTNVRGTFATTSQRIALRAHTPVPWNYDVGNREELAADVACPPHIDPAGLRRDVDEIIDQLLSRSSHAVSSDFVPLAFDAAATAIANGLALYTTNPSDFEAISGLDVRTVPHPEAAMSPPPEE